jgi:hypothetical protein
MKYITSHQDCIDLFVFGNIDNLGKHCSMFIHAGAVPDGSADMPV